MDPRWPHRDAVVELLTRAESGPPRSEVLCGLPFAVKEIIDVAGQPRLAGSAVPVGGVVSTARRHAPIVEALCAAGALPVARTVSHEYAWGISGLTPSRHGPMNPVAPGRVPGGSSSGSAVLVAAGAVGLGLGTDTAGSIRIPAAYCGVFGFKPTFGRLPTDGIIPLAPSFDTVGLLAADLLTLGTVWGCLSGERPLQQRPASAILLDMHPSRLAVTGGVEPSIFRGLTDVARRLSTFGFVVTETELPWESAADVFAPLQMSEALHVHRDVLRTWPDCADMYGGDVAARLTAAERISEEQVGQASVEREQIAGLAAGLLGADVVVLSIVSPAFPPMLRDPDTVNLPAGPASARSAVLPFTTPASLIGLPAISVPIGRDGGGLPLSVQLIAGPGAEDRLLATTAVILDLLAG